MSQKRKETGVKVCAGCGKPFERKPRHPVASFLNQKHCSRECSSLRRRKLTKINCPQCGNEFKPEASRTKYCSQACSSKAHKGKTSEIGMPARYKKVAGVLEHRAVMEKVIGRKLVKGESVHHKNGDRFDNRPENLELWYSAQPSGQRVDDLIDYIVAHHRSRLQSHLSILLGEQESLEDAA